METRSAKARADLIWYNCLRGECWTAVAVPPPTAHRRQVTMSKVEDIEKAVAGLSADELAKFRDWFEQFEGARLDKRIEQDATAGRLDQLAERALDDFGT